MESHTLSACKAGRCHLRVYFRLRSWFSLIGGMSEEHSDLKKRNHRETASQKGPSGIAGMQTGVYQIRTPGGWHINHSYPSYTI